GFDAISIDSGVQAIDLILTQKPDLVLLELALADIDGKEVIRTVRESSAAPIIVISARSREAEKIEALDAGANTRASAWRRQTKCRKWRGEPRGRARPVQEDGAGARPCAQAHPQGTGAAAGADARRRPHRAASFHPAKALGRLARHERAIFAGAGAPPAPENRDRPGFTETSADRGRRRLSP